MILDNCDDFLQKNKTHENNFKEIFIELLKASKYLRILTTSRAQMIFVDGFYANPLKELDSSSAVTLLQLRSKLITSDEGKVIADLVGNNPLALGIVAELINAKSSPPYAIIDELRKHLMQTLSPNTVSNSERISTVLKLSYNYLDNRIQVCSHYLSHFPGSFHRAAAQSILSMCNLSDPEYCLQTLVERSLLEKYWHTDHLRYQFHRLFGKFLHYIQAEHRIGHAIKCKTDFTLNYQLYYSQDILSLSKQFSGSSASNEIVSRLEHDIHHFKNILQKMAERQLHIKSALNIAYSFTNSSDFLIEVLNCDDRFVKLLQGLIVIFDQNIPEISREVGLYETAVLYFNLISKVKKLLMISEVSTDSCMTVCTSMFTTHYSRVEKLSAADGNAYYYHLLTCELDCLYIPGYSLIQAATFLLTFVSICIMKFIRQCVKDRCIIIPTLGFIIFIVSMQLVVRLRYFTIVAFFFKSNINNIILRYSNRFMYSYYFVAMCDVTIFVISLSLCMVVFCYGSIFIIIKIVFFNKLVIDAQFLMHMYK